MYFPLCFAAILSASAIVFSVVLVLTSITEQTNLLSLLASTAIASDEAANHGNLRDSNNPQEKAFF